MIIMIHHTISLGHILIYTLFLLCIIWIFIRKTYIVITGFNHGKYEISYIDKGDELNRICERENVKKLPATRLTEILVAEGIISSETESNGFSKIPTEKGKVLGVIVEDRVSQKGNEYHVLKYSPEIQKILVEHYVVKLI